MSNKSEILTVLKGYIKSTFFCLVTGLIALYIAECVNHHFYISRMNLQIQRLSGVILAASGVYGMQGWELQTFSGDTPQEKLNKRLYHILMGVGYIATVFTFGLEEN